MSALCHKCGCTIDEDELTLCGQCSNHAPVQSAEISTAATFAGILRCILKEDDDNLLWPLIESRDAAQRQAGREEALKECVELLNAHHKGLDSNGDQIYHIPIKALADLAQERKG